jgi:hypothetical protein
LFEAGVIKVAEAKSGAMEHCYWLTGRHTTVAIAAMELLPDA